MFNHVQYAYIACGAAHTHNIYIYINNIIMGTVIIRVSAIYNNIYVVAVPI